MLSLSTQKLVLDKGASASLTISESGAYSSTVKLGYRVVKAPGLKVGPLQVNIQKFAEKPGFSTSVDISAKENAMPGEYAIEFYPITPGYGSDVVYYGKKNLTVIVKGGKRPFLLLAPLPHKNQRQKQKTETSTQGENADMTLTTSIPTTTTLSTTTTSKQQTPSTTPTLVLTTSPSTTVVGKTEFPSTNMLIGILGAVIVALLLVVILLKRRSS